MDDVLGRRVCPPDICDWGSYGRFNRDLHCTFGKERTFSPTRCRSVTGYGRVLNIGASSGGRAALSGTFVPGVPIPIAR